MQSASGLEPDDIRKKLRERARKYLKHHRAQLPKLTSKQSALVVKMMLAAYFGGARDVYDEWRESDTLLMQEEDEKRIARSRKGVIARRKKSKRSDIRADFEVARKAGRVLTPQHLANKHGTSLATVYRAVGDLLKQSPS
jgi:hypothetical protein